MNKSLANDYRKLLELLPKDEWEAHVKELVDRAYQDEDWFHEEPPVDNMRGTPYWNEEEG